MHVLAQAANRNNVDEVAAYLRKHHHGRYLVFNLMLDSPEQTYDVALFENQVTQDSGATTWLSHS